MENKDDDYVKGLEQRIIELEYELETFVEKHSESVVYKIRNEEGNFSNGGRFPGWTKKGKIWNSIGRLKAHLKLVSTFTARKQTSFFSPHPYLSAKVLSISTFVTEDIEITLDPDTKKFSIDSYKAPVKI